MLKRVLALLILPAAAVVLYRGVSIWSRRAVVAPDAARYAVEADLFVLLAPSVVIYLVALPFVWRRVQRASARAVAMFSSLTFVLMLAGLALLMGPLYRVISRGHPVLADQLFFWVFPFAPVVFAIMLSLRVLRQTPREERAT